MMIRLNWVLALVLAGGTVCLAAEDEDFGCSDKTGSGSRPPQQAKTVAWQPIRGGTSLRATFDQLLAVRIFKPSDFGVVAESPQSPPTEVTVQMDVRDEKKKLVHTSKSRVKCKELPPKHRIKVGLTKKGLAALEPHWRKGMSLEIVVSYKAELTFSPQEKDERIQQASISFPLERLVQTPVDRREFGLLLTPSRWRALRFHG